MIYNGQESVWLYGRTAWSRGRSRLDYPAYYIGQQFSWLEYGIWDAVVASSSLVYPTFDQCRRELLQCLWYSFKLSLNVLSNHVGIVLIGQVATLSRLRYGFDSRYPYINNARLEELVNSSAFHAGDYGFEPHTEYFI